MTGFTIRTTSTEATRALGRRLGTHLRAGDVVALSGDLGTGKTVLAQGIAAGAGATGYMASPTFTFVREYAGPLRVYHVDLYRIDNPRQLDDLGLDEMLDGAGIVVIEWAEKMGPLLPAGRLRVAMEFGAGPDDRVIRFTAHGTRYEEILKQLPVTNHQSPVT